MLLLTPDSPPSKSELRALGEMYVGGKQLIQVRPNCWLTPILVPEDITPILVPEDITPAKIYAWHRCSVIQPRTLAMLIVHNFITAIPSGVRIYSDPTVHTAYELTACGETAALAHKDRWFLSDETCRLRDLAFPFEKGKTP